MSQLTQETKSFLQDVSFLSKLSVSKKYKKIQLDEYPFDAQVLNASRLYRESRKAYLQLSGTFSPRVCSMMRGLSSQDLFKSEIDYSPSFSELLWFKNQIEDVTEPEDEMKALSRFNEISLYHEQNHRVIWQLLPPAPKEDRDFSRYLNFAESLVVTLDLALGDELGMKNSTALQRLNVIYRHGGQHPWARESKQDYRQYLLALMCTTYYALEMLHYDDILKAVDYVLPGQKKTNKAAVKRGLELSELFTRVTNPQWQERYLQESKKKLQKIHSNSKHPAFYLPEDPLDLEEEFILAKSVFNFFGL